MSKMSEIAMELDDQAAELGFESYEEALAKGYVIDYLQGKLVKQDEQESAHEAWLKEREELLERLEKKQDKLKRMLCDDTGLYDLITDTINFIKKGEM